MLIIQAMLSKNLLTLILLYRDRFVVKQTAHMTAGHSVAVLITVVLKASTKTQQTFT